MPVSKNKRNKSGKNRTSLKQHKAHGKSLKPAFSMLEEKLEGRLFFSNWTYERLPEMLWAAIIRSLLSQEDAIQYFNKILASIMSHPDRNKIKDISLSGIAELDEVFREDLIKIIVSEPIIAKSLSILNLFPSLPARNSWMKFLPSTPPDIDLLMTAVGNTLFHQSQEATDCRWLRVMGLVAADKLIIPKDMMDEILGYPNVGDQRKVRPTIRSLEMTFNIENAYWPKEFWNECWNETPCFELNEINQRSDEKINELSSIKLIKNKLLQHWRATHQTTEIDAKHDCVFGIILYSLRIIHECTEGKVTTGILGRMSLRSIFENRLTLHYLMMQDDKELWSKWRKYGAGQAKLNALRFDEEEMSPPKFINSETLETIAGEDTWEEYLDIELGNWTNLDLRKLSLSSKIKDEYDKYYSWTSGFSHGNWGAIRESEFSTCGNPLHRLHRIPKSSTLPSVRADLENLFNFMLNDLDTLYPNFPYRLEL